MLTALQVVIAAVLAVGGGPASRLIVVTGVDGAEVSLDERPIGATPLDTSIAPGRHHVAVTHPGFVTTSTTIEVEPGGTARLVVPLSAMPPGRRRGVTVGAAFAYGATAPRRFTLWTGVRDRSDRWELNLCFEGDAATLRGGLATRVYALTGAVRPFARAAVLGPNPAIVGGIGVAFGRFDHRSGRDFFGLVELELRRVDGLSTTFPATIGVMARL